MELGFTVSDTGADSAIIEKGNLLSVKNGVKVVDLLEISSKIAPQVDTLWMGYFNLFYQKGMDFFTQEASRLGVNGFIIPDLPHEESVAYKNLVEDGGLALIDFVAPTHSRDRIEKIVTQSRKFIYLVAYAGITGSGKEEDLSTIISQVKEFSDTPLYIGFGVNEKNAREKAKGVDGVIVGSAFVKVLLDESLTHSQKISNITALSREIKESINS